MPRGRQPSRSEIAPDELEYYDKVAARGRNPNRLSSPSRSLEDAGHDLAYYGRLLLSPRMAYHLSELGGLVRAVGLRPGSYSHADRELVDQVLCNYRKTNLVLLTHIPDALAAGVRMEAIEALRYGRDEDLTPEEREFATFVRQVVDLELTDELWDEMERRLGERGVLELTIFIALLNMILTLQSALKVPALSDEQVDQLIRDLKEGRRQVPQFVNRSGV